MHEKVGVYDNYHSGLHASMVLTEEIDLRIFPAHWKHAFMVEKETDTGLRRSFQVFDAAGDAVHKIYLRDASDHAAWASIRHDLRLEDQSSELAVSARAPTEAAKSDPDRADVLRKEWARMTDTHQFLRLTSKMKMNRLGAYRVRRRALRPAGRADFGGWRAANAGIGRDRGDDLRRQSRLHSDPFWPPGNAQGHGALAKRT